MNHPPQREMWEGLKKSGCFIIVGIVVISTIIGAILQ
jgi:hypothetical protein